MAPDEVYFARIDPGGEISAAREVIASDLAAEGQAYRLNVEPGRYVVVGALERTQVGHELKLFLDEPTIRKTEVEVVAGEMALVGRVLVDLSPKLKKSDGAQLHYSRLIEHSKKRAYRGSLLFVDRGPATLRAQLVGARDQIFSEEPAWKERVEAALAILEQTSEPAPAKRTGVVDEVPLVGTTWTGGARIEPRSSGFGTPVFTGGQSWEYVFDFLEDGLLRYSTGGSDDPRRQDGSSFRQDATDLRGRWQRWGKQVYLTFGSPAKPSSELVGRIAGVQGLPSVKTMSGEGIDRSGRWTWTVRMGAKPSRLTQWRMNDDRGRRLLHTSKDHRAAEEFLLAALEAAEGLGLDKAPKLTGINKLLRRQSPLSRGGWDRADPPLGRTFDALAGLYHAQKRYADLEKIAKRSLAMRERELGPDCKYLSRSLTDLARAHRGQGRETEAKALEERASALPDGCP